MVSPYVWAIRRFDSYGGHDVRFVSVQKWQERGNQTAPNLVQARGGLSAPATSDKGRSETVPTPKERLMW